MIFETLSDPSSGLPMRLGPSRRILRSRPTAGASHCGWTRPIWPGWPGIAAAESMQPRRRRTAAVDSASARVPRCTSTATLADSRSTEDHSRNRGQTESAASADTRSSSRGGAGRADGVLVGKNRPRPDQDKPTARRPSSVRRPRTRPDVVLADRAYSSRAIRLHLSRRGILAVAPQPCRHQWLQVLRSPVRARAVSLPVRLVGQLAGVPTMVVRSTVAQLPFGWRAVRLMWPPSVEPRE